MGLQGIFDAIIAFLERLFEMIAAFVARLEGADD